MSTYITGDTHGDFSRFPPFCDRFQTDRNDTMIILGDAGLNYFEDYCDAQRKTFVSRIPLTFFCIHGNHEARPIHFSSYSLKTFHGGQVWAESKYPNILFAKDGEVYEFEGKNCLVIGGAYSVDKDYRIARGWNWFSDEQPDEEVKEKVEETLQAIGNKVDYVFSHTCPLRYMPTEAFLPTIDQSTVDRSTEEWLGRVESQAEYMRWFCGHFHIEKKIDRMRFPHIDHFVWAYGTQR